MTSATPHTNPSSPRSPWASPHVHFNVFLNGRHIDPFPILGSGKASLWLDGTSPEPLGQRAPEPFEPSTYHEANLRELVKACRVPALEARLAQLHNVEALGDELLFQTSYFPTRFEYRLPLYEQIYERQPILTLPFLNSDYRGISLSEAPSP